MNEVYVIAKKDNNGIYIGQTRIGWKKRWVNHLYHLRSGHHRNSWLQRSFNQYGESAFNCSLLERYATQGEANEAEKFYITYLKFLGAKVYNSRSGGVIGSILSQEARKKIADAASRNSIGRLMHPNTRAALRLANLNRTMSESHKRKLIESIKGKRRSAASIEKQRLASIGRILPLSHRRAISLGLIGRPVSAATRVKISEKIKQIHANRRLDCVGTNGCNASTETINEE